MEEGTEGERKGKGERLSGERGEEGVGKYNNST